VDITRAAFRTHGLYVAALVATAVFAYCQSKWSKDASEKLGAARRDLQVSDSIARALRVDSIELTLRVESLLIDSALLADAAVELRSEFQREFARWQTLVAGFQAVAGRIDTVLVTPGDSLPSIEDVVRQANATIESCRSLLSNCEERAQNAEFRLSEIDGLRLNAEARATQYLQQARTWERIARPSWWEQLKQIPGRAASHSVAASIGYAACKIGG
jgi:hypothetical protein